MMASDPDEAAASIIAAEQKRPTGKLVLNNLALNRLPAAVTKLTWLREIHLFGTGIRDLAPIANLEELQCVDCAESSVRDLAPISRLLNLRKLECSNTGVSSLTPIAKLGELRTVYCWNTEIESLDPLSDLNLLGDFDCNGTFALDLNPIANKPRLFRLNISRNEIDRLSNLGCLPRLETLFCNKTIIAELPVRNAFPRLLDLEVSESAVTNLEIVARFSTLERFDCSDTTVSDLGPLTTLTRLRELNCSGCHLRSLPAAVWDRSNFKLFAWKTRVPGIPSRVLSGNRNDDCAGRLRKWTDYRLGRRKQPEDGAGPSRGTISTDRTDLGAARIAAQGGNPISAFISYSHADRLALHRLHTHLAMLIREGTLSAWTDHEILPGDPIDGVIADQLEKTSLFIALVSPDYLASHYCYEEEFRRAQHLAAFGRLRIIPVILEPCDWLSSPMKTFKALPRNGRPISSYENTNEAYLNVAQDLRRVLELPNA